MSDPFDEAVKELHNFFTDYEGGQACLDDDDRAAAATLIEESFTPKEHLRTARDVLLETVPEDGTVTRECMVSVFNEILGEKP